jgi:hypothetical protein
MVQWGFISRFNRLAAILFGEIMPDKRSLNPKQ